MKTFLITIALCVSSVTSFGVSSQRAVASTQQPSSSTALSMAGEDADLLKQARSARSAQAGDNVVELMRPLGLVLNSDDDGNVYVETLAPRGNAARTGKVGNKFWDYTSLCSWRHSTDRLLLFFLSIQTGQGR